MFGPTVEDWWLSLSCGLKIRDCLTFEAVLILPGLPPAGAPRRGAALDIAALPAMLLEISRGCQCYRRNQRLRRIDGVLTEPLQCHRME